MKDAGRITPRRAVMSESMLSLPKRLRQAKRGHPYAKIPWPHSILEEAATRIDALEAEVESLRKTIEINDKHYQSKFDDLVRENKSLGLIYKRLLDFAKEIERIADSPLSNADAMKEVIYAVYALQESEK
jgi:hypothetical protein